MTRTLMFVALALASVLTVGALFLTVAWVGFAPLVLPPAGAMYLLGRRVGIFDGATRSRRTGATVLAIVAAHALAITTVVWGASRG